MFSIETKESDYKYRHLVILCQAERGLMKGETSKYNLLDNRDLNAPTLASKLNVEFPFNASWDCLEVVYDFLIQNKKGSLIIKEPLCNIGSMSFVVGNPKLLILDYDEFPRDF